MSAWFDVATVEWAPPPTSLAAHFHTQMALRFGEQALDRLDAIYDPVCDAYYCRCPHCAKDREDPQNLYRPLIVADNGNVLCQTGCEYHAILAAAIRNQP